MADILLNSSIALRQCILYECVGKTPIFKAYKGLCAKLGSNFMSYQEFEFWFMKFSRKEYDMDYDRSQDPKYTEFSDLPNSLLNRIVDEVEPFDRLILQKVCRPLRQLLATRNPGFRTICIDSSEDHFEVHYDGNTRCYGIAMVELDGHPLVSYQLTGSVQICWWILNPYGRDWKKKSIIEGDVFKIASNDLAIVVGNEQLSLDEFEIRNAYPEFNEHFLQILTSRNRKILTKKLRILNPDMQQVEFLQFFDVKEEILVHFCTDLGYFTELIRNPGKEDAKMLTVILLKFPRITAVLEPCFLSDEDMIDPIRNAILTSEIMELFKITCLYGRGDMDKTSKLLFPNALENSHNPNISYVTVPNTEKTLEMKVEEHHLQFRRL